MTPTLARLWSELAARPDDPAVRIVLGDALQAIGDPQGDYIAQVDSTDPATIDASELLLQEHARTWLGALAPFTRRAQFIRGFPTRVELTSQVPSDRELATLLADPRLASVEDLVTGAAKDWFYAALVANPIVTALRRIEIKGADTLAALETTTARLEHVSIPVWHGRGELLEVLANQILPACERFPTLTSLAIPDEALDTLTTTALFRRLQTITVGPDLRAIAYWSALAPHQTLVIAPPRLPACTRGSLVATGPIVLQRRDGSTVARAQGTSTIAALPATIAAFPRDVTRLELVGEVFDLGALRDAAELRNLELVLIPGPRLVGYV